MMEPKLQTLSPPHTDGLGALGNWHSGRTQSLIPNRHWSSLFTFNLLRALFNLQKWLSKGVSSIPFYPQITPPLLCSFGKETLTYSFIVVPQCPMALMGHDLLAKPQTSINLPFLDPISTLCIQMAPEPLASRHSQNLPPDLPP